MNALPNAKLSPESVFMLRDGRPLRISPVTPAARPLIEKAIAGLSPESSRRRFFTVRYRLSDRELDALTHLDGRDRYALGATVIRPEGGLEGVGVARFVRVADSPSVAEVAVLVVDAYQGQGVGKALLMRLSAAGAVRGINRFRGIVLPDNMPMLALLRKHASGGAMSRSDGLINFDVPLTAGFAAATH